MQLVTRQNVARFVTLRSLVRSLGEECNCEIYLTGACKTVWFRLRDKRVSQARDVLLGLKRADALKLRVFS
jgi:hypothetical protein